MQKLHFSNKMIQRQGDSEAVSQMMQNQPSRDVL